MTPIRRNFAHLSQAERNAFVTAFQALDASKVFPDGVSYWDKQDQIHQATHVHGGPSFLPWHRELCNRLEAMLQEVDPNVALHYWDWTTDPTNSPDGQGGTVNLFTAQHLGSSSGRAGDPFDTFDNGGVLAGSRDQTGDPADPPQEITRAVQAGAPTVVDADAQIVASADHLPPAQQFNFVRRVIEGVIDHTGTPQVGWNHNGIHGYIGGTIGQPHSAFEDPFVFLLHSNVDRLWAMWQAEPGYGWRLDPAQTYGDESTHVRITEDLEPWAGGSGMRPWAPPENQTEVKTSLHPSVVRPPCYDTLPLSVELHTPLSGAPIEFNAVPEGVTTVRAAVFTVQACMDVTLEITAGPGAGFGAPLGTSFVVPYAGGYIREGRVWVSFTGTTAGAMASGQVTIHCPETGDEWVIDITAVTVPKPTVASMLVLDKSGSMAWDSGIPGQRRLDVLRWAAPHYVQLMDDDDAVGIVSFDHDAYPVMGVTPAGPPVFGAGRAAAAAAIAAHDEDGGATSIGDGVELAHLTVNPVGGFDHKAQVVFTDGKENSYKSLADVSGLLNERVFAIGLGRADQLNVTKLEALASGSGGFVMITGDLGVDDLFRVSKYFLQVLAGVTKTEIVVDPEATLGPGQKHRIPFHLTEADYRADVVLLAPVPWAIDLVLETPSGTLVAPADAVALPGATHAVTPGAQFYRFQLPLLLEAPEHGGRWHALLRLDDSGVRRAMSSELRTHAVHGTANFLRRGIPYSLSVQARSTVALGVWVTQSSHEPGAEVSLRARLSQYDLPITARATVRVEVARPDGSRVTVPLVQGEPGAYAASFVADLPGVYELRYLARGMTLAGLPFTREALRTAAVTPGADREPPRPDDPWEAICELLACLLSDGGLEKALVRAGIDPDRLRRCLARRCGRPSHKPAGAVAEDAATQLIALLRRPEVLAALKEDIERKP